MLSIKEFINQFYIENKTILDDFYPGVQVRKILEIYCQYNHQQEDELYLGDMKNFFPKILRGIPFEHIVTNSYFYKSNFYVDKNVLIPRSETEILVEDAVAWTVKNHFDGFRIAEIGIGSFVIGLSLMAELKFPISFWGGDISEAAIKVAELNRFRLSSKIHPMTKIEIHNSDCLNELNENVDLILSNPPYIKSSAKSTVHKQVNLYEPHIALYIEAESYDEWFNKLFMDCSKKLNENGAFFMEGHEDTLESLKEIALKYFKKVELKNDYTGRLRFLYAYR